MPELLIETGPWHGRLLSFERSAVIGRGEMVDLRLEEVTVSRQHALLKLDGGQWTLEDLGSANGTFVNGTRLEAPVTLGSGDRVRVGDLEMSFRIEPPATPAPLVTPLPEESSRGRVFQELLSRVRVFVDLGELAAGRHATPEEIARKGLQILLQGFSRVDRAALFVHVPVGDTLSLLAQATRDGRALQPTAIAPLAREAMHHQTGLLLLDEAERNALTERLRMNPLYGACAAIPARHGGELLGVLYLDSMKDVTALRASDQEHLIAAAGLLACLVAPLREPRRDFEVERHDLTLARRIQQRFLPQSPPTLTGYSIVDSYAAARVIGGDHYDFVTLGDGRHALVVADVSGKALSGALYMARLGAVLKQAASRARRASDLLDEINRVLYAELEAGMFVTMVALVLEPRTGQLELASAGHPLPLMRHRDTRVETLTVTVGPPLGAMSDPTYETGKHMLASGDCVLLYTDGLSEAHAKDGGVFGIDRVRNVMVASEDARSAIDRLREELGKFVGGEPQNDDLTLVALQRL